MNAIAWKVTGLVMAVSGIAVLAQQGPPPDAAPPQGADRPPQEKIISQFDADGDGQLNESERQAMREAFRRSRGGPGRGGPDRAQMMKRFDADGDGQLNEEERAALEAARAERRAERARRYEELLKKYDADGDGQLSEEERKTMREALRAEREQNAAPAEEAAEKE